MNRAIRWLLFVMNDVIYILIDKDQSTALVYESYSLHVFSSFVHFWISLDIYLRINLIFGY